MTEAIFQTAKDAYGDSVGDAPTQWVDLPRHRHQDAEHSTQIRPAPRPSPQTVQRQMADDLIGQYMAWLENYLGVNINTAALAQAIGNSSNGPLDSN